MAAPIRKLSPLGRRRRETHRALQQAVRRPGNKRRRRENENGAYFGHLPGPIKKNTFRLQTSQVGNLPLKPAEDAKRIDTTGLTVVQVFDRVLQWVDH